MNRAIKPATLINYEGSTNPFQLRPSFFHYSPFLERRRRTHWDSGGSAYRGSPRRFNNYNKRFRKLHTKQDLLRNVSAFAEKLLQSWKNGTDEYDTSSSKKNSWFRQDSGASGNRGGWSRNRGHSAWSRRGFQFCEDDDFDVETIFRSAFGGNRHFYWSFTSESSESEFSSSKSGDEYESDEDDGSEASLTSDRLALGLSASGPLTVEDVKKAYRECALKWHPDRHQGSSKAVAEEKFKMCSASYQSLCDKLAVN